MKNLYFEPDPDMNDRFPGALCTEVSHPSGACLTASVYPGRVSIHNPDGRWVVAITVWYPNGTSEPYAVGGGRDRYEAVAWCTEKLTDALGKDL